MRKRDARQFHRLRRLPQTPAAEASPSSGENGGQGEIVSPRTENQLISLMIHRDRQVWPLSDRHKRAAVAVLVRHMTSANPRIAGGAVRNLLAMESQNMRQEAMDRGVELPHVDINVILQQPPTELERLSDAELAAQLAACKAELLRLEANTIEGTAVVREA